MAWLYYNSIEVFNTRLLHYNPYDFTTVQIFQARFELENENQKLSQFHS